MQRIVSVNPFRCRVWSEHERMAEQITEGTCGEEIRSFQRHGQQIAALGRPWRTDPEHDIEVICGARRLFVARHLNRELLIEIREMSDRDAVVALDLENRQRKDLSPYERGVSYQNWLRKGYFSSQEEIGRLLGISTAQVSRLVTLASLPSVIVEAFNGGFEMRETWGVALHKAWHDRRRQPELAQVARNLVAEQPRRPPAAIYERLLTSSGKSGRPRRAAGDEVIRNRVGNALYRIRYRGRSIFLVLPKNEVSESKLSEVKAAVTAVLQNGTQPQVSSATSNFSQTLHPVRAAPRALPRRISDALVIIPADARAEGLTVNHVGRVSGSL